MNKQYYLIVGLLCLVSNTIFCSLNELDDLKNMIEDSEIEHWNQLVTINNRRDSSHIPEFETIITKKKIDLNFSFTPEDIKKTQNELKQKQQKKSKNNNNNKKKKKKGFSSSCPAENNTNVTHNHNDITNIPMQESEETIIKNAIKKHQFKFAQIKIKKIKNFNIRQKLNTLFNEEYKNSVEGNYNNHLNLLMSKGLLTNNLFTIYNIIFSSSIVSEYDKEIIVLLQSIIKENLKEDGVLSFFNYKDEPHLCNDQSCFFNHKTLADIKQIFKLDQEKK